jgi:hypothetical protein
MRVSKQGWTTSTKTARWYKHRLFYQRSSSGPEPGPLQIQSLGTSSRKRGTCSACIVRVTACASHYSSLVRSVPTASSHVHRLRKCITESKQHSMHIRKGDVTGSIPSHSKTCRSIQTFLTFTSYLPRSLNSCYWTTLELRQPFPTPLDPVPLFIQHRYTLKFLLPDLLQMYFIGTLCSKPRSYILLPKNCLHRRI